MPEKAYKNLQFLNSADARILRILAEYVEPRSRFRRENVHDTIVFFGSARTQSAETAEAQLKTARADLLSSDSEENRRNLKLAEKRLEMSAYYEDARKLSRLLTEWALGHTDKRRKFVVASGGGPGIMEAANRGASEVDGGRSVGLNISLPMEQGGNPYITDALNFEFHYFFTRKFWFIYLAKAIVVFPGGFGTLDEVFEVLTLIQTGKTAKKMPVVLFGKSYWNRLINFDMLVENLVINESDMNLIRFCDTPKEAFAYLTSRL